MKHPRPTKIKGNAYPIYTFENGIRLNKEKSQSFQQVNKWLKVYVGSSKNLFHEIERSIYAHQDWYCEKNGNVYTFTTDREIQLAKLEGYFKKFSTGDIQIGRVDFNREKIELIFNEVENENNIITTEVQDISTPHEIDRNTLNEEIYLIPVDTNDKDDKVKMTTNIVNEKNDIKESETASFPEEIDDPDTYPEGAKKQIVVNAYERNPRARKDCLSKYGYSCQVCKFDFVSIYGEIGKGFIHVHHIKELSLIGEEYQVDGEKDLVPVCPNCHAMLHKKKPAYTVAELKKLISDNKPCK